MALSIEKQTDLLSKKGIFYLVPLFIGSIVFLFFTLNKKNKEHEEYLRQQNSECNESKAKLIEEIKEAYKYKGKADLLDTIKGKQ